MSFELYIGFVIATLILCIMPGPVVTYLVACGLERGPRAALAGLTGTTSALILHMALLLLGLAPLLSSLGTWAEIIRLAGAAYLVWLGIAAFRAKPAEQISDMEAEHLTPRLTGQDMFTLYRRGFFISVSNPKSLAFYAAFFPQFITASLPIMPQLVLLCVGFLIISTLSDGAYGLAAGKLAPFLKSKRAQITRNRITGTVLIAAGIGLALTRN